MVSRGTISAVIGGVALGAGIAVATTSAGQEPGRTVLIQQPSGPATPPPAPGAPPRGAPTGDLHVTALAADTFVTVKDHGDSQTISVFKIDSKGVNHMTHKAKFFY